MPRTILQLLNLGAVIAPGRRDSPARQLPSGPYPFNALHFPRIFEPEEFLEELFLLIRELRGGLEVHNHHQVTRGFAPEAGQTQARKSENGPGLRAGRNGQAGWGRQGGDLHLRPQAPPLRKRLAPGNGDPAFAGKDGMGGDADLQVEVSRGRPQGPGFPFSPEAQAGAGVHPRRNAHLDLLFFLDDPGPRKRSRER